MPPSRGGRSSNRKTTPVSPPKARANVASPGTRRSTRSTSREVEQAVTKRPVQTDLRPVQEEELSSSAEDLDDSDQSSEASSVDSAEESEHLDRDAIIDGLSDLHRDSTKLLHFLTQTQQSPDDENLINKRAAPTYRRYVISREAYGGNIYIKLSSILYKLTNGQQFIADNGLWRPDAVLYLANLALLVKSICSNNKSETEACLNELFNSFPDPFCTSAEESRFAASPALDTFNLGLDMRTQFFIQTCASQLENPDFDPDLVLGEVFITQGEQPRASNPQDAEQNDLTVARIKAIRQSFATRSDRSVNLRKLENAFPWTDFRSQLCDWAILRQKELNDQITTQGGIDKIVDLLSAGDFESTTSEQPNAKSTTPEPIQDAPVWTSITPNASKPDKTPTGSIPLTSSKLEKNIARLREMKAASAARRSGSNIAPLPSTPVNQSEATPKSKAANTTIAEASNKTIMRQPESSSELNQSAAAGPSLNPTKKPSTTAKLIDDDGGAVVLDEEPSVPTQGTIIPTQQTSMVLGVLKAQAQQSSKENVHKEPVRKPKKSLMDRQEGATRLNFDDSQDEATRSPERRREPLQKVQVPVDHTRKRKPLERAESEDEEEDTDAFEQDIREPKRLRIAQEKRPAKSRLVDEDNQLDLIVEAEDDEDDEEEEEEEEEDLPVPRRHQTQAPPRKNLSSSAQPLRTTLPQRNPLPPSTAPAPSNQNSSTHHQSRYRLGSGSPIRSRSQTTPSSTFSLPPSSSAAALANEVNMRAKQARRLAQTNMAVHQNDFKIQVRKPYSMQEVNRLMDLISQCGTGWSKMLALDNDLFEDDGGPMLQGRTQVQLKDKARNMKMDFLKARMPLPPGFEAVSIGQKMIESLRSMGINYTEGHAAGQRM